LEVAGIAGTSTPSPATSNCQLAGLGPVEHPTNGRRYGWNRRGSDNNPATAQ